MALPWPTPFPKVVPTTYGFSLSMALPVTKSRSSSRSRSYPSTGRRTERISVCCAGIRTRMWCCCKKRSRSFFLRHDTELPINGACPNSSRYNDQYLRKDSGTLRFLMRLHLRSTGGIWLRRSQPLVSRPRVLTLRKTRRVRQPGPGWREGGPAPNLHRLENEERANERSGDSAMRI